MRQDELRLTQQNYMKKTKAGKISPKELEILLEIGADIAEENEREIKAVSADVKKFGELVAAQAEESERTKIQVSQDKEILKSFLVKHDLIEEFNAYYASQK